MIPPKPQSLFAAAGPYLRLFSTMHCSNMCAHRIKGVCGPIWGKSLLQTKRLQRSLIYIYDKRPPSSESLIVVENISSEGPKLPLRNRMCFMKTVTGRVCAARARKLVEVPKTSLEACLSMMGIIEIIYPRTRACLISRTVRTRSSKRAYVMTS